jgi:hypothetical protein
MVSWGAGRGKRRRLAGASEPRPENTVMRTAVVLLVAVLGCRSVPPRPPAPDFRLPDSTGRERTLAEFRGRVLLLDFWAPW